MPVLKRKTNGVWVDVAGASGHTHNINDIINFPSSLPANGGNADTLDGKHANEFALTSDVEALDTKIGDKSVSEQIATAIEEIDIVPSVTTDDNGKFMRVVNGVWAASTIPNAEEATFGV
jgi:hypothetical protein